MSHLPQRKENNCLNCGAEVIGRFCHDCGQENIEAKETLWHLTSHLLNDITHFDGKFFTSLKDLILKPGFLSKEYIIGRRTKYLHPIRMYLFTSAIFFLIFFSFYNINSKIKIGFNNDAIMKMDSTDFADYTKVINKGKPMTKEEYLKHRVNIINIAPGNYNSKAEYDSLLRTGKKKHNWFERQLVYKQLEFKEKYNSDPKLILPALINKFLHSIPQMLFILLPLFALVLKLLYVRRKQFYYVDHAIFAIHFYIFAFIDMLLIFAISEIKNWLNWQWLSYLVLVLILTALFYLYKSMRNFYRQRRAKTIFKYILLLIMLFVISFILFIIFGFLSIFGI